ncbi:MAG: efflux RND transporter periplasmic adaptor subunit, partial [Candidatus Omnitrophota bacterium]
MGSKLLKLLLILVLAFVMWGVYQTGIKLSTQKTPFIQDMINKVKKEPPPAAQKQNAATPARQEEPPAQQQAPSEPAPIMVRVFKMKPTDFHDFLPVMGTVKGKTEIELKFEIPGVIKKIYFKEGEKVRKSALIAYLVPDDAKLKLKYARNKFISAQAAYESSLKKYEINQKLFEVGAIIKSKMEEAELDARSAKAQVDTAKAEEDLAKNDFRKVFLYSTKDGVMGPREAEEGEFVTSQDKMGTLFEISEVYIEVGIVERDINKVRLGQKASIYVDAYPTRVFEGTVDSVYPIIEGKSRTLTAKIKV